MGQLSVVVRTAGEPTALAGSVREAIRSVDKAVPIYNLKTMNDVVSTSAAPRRVPMLLLSAFAGVAMLLAMLGIYGVTSYYVTQRTHEIGVRMALGAQIADVLKLVLQRAMLLAIAGIGIGVIGAVAVTRYMTTLLFGVKPIDVDHVRWSRGCVGGCSSGCVSRSGAAGRKDRSARSAQVVHRFHSFNLCNLWRIPGNRGVSQ